MFAVELKNVTKKYDKSGYKKKSIEAVNNVSLRIGYNQTLALIGESGCGKTTLMNLILGNVQPNSGSITILGSKTDSKERKRLSGVQAVFQDSAGSLDPRWTVGRSISEPLIYLMNMNKSELSRRVEELLQVVELTSDYAFRFPHELSGGEQKRVCIARAIASNPKLLLLDEAVSGLDAITQKKILDLLLKIKDKLQCSYLFITHDINMAIYIADIIAVMKDGAIVETNSNFRKFHHPYSKMLINNCLSKATVYDRFIPSRNIKKEGGRYIIG